MRLIRRGKGTFLRMRIRHDVVARVVSSRPTFDCRPAPSLIAMRLGDCLGQGTALRPCFRSDDLLLVCGLCARRPPRRVRPDVPRRRGPNQRFLLTEGLRAGRLTSSRDHDSPASSTCGPYDGNRKRSLRRVAEPHNRPAPEVETSCIRIHDNLRSCRWHVPFSA